MGGYKRHLEEQREGGARGHAWVSDLSQQDEQTGGEAGASSQLFQPTIPTCPDACRGCSGYEMLQSSQFDNPMGKRKVPGGGTPDTGMLLPVCCTSNSMNPGIHLAGGCCHQAQFTDDETEAQESSQSRQQTVVREEAEHKAKLQSPHV